VCVSFSVCVCLYVSPQCLCLCVSHYVSPSVCVGLAVCLTQCCVSLFSVCVSFSVCVTLSVFVSLSLCMYMYLSMCSFLSEAMKAQRG